MDAFSTAPFCVRFFSASIPCIWISRLDGAELRWNFLPFVSEQGYKRDCKERVSSLQSLF